MAQRKSLAWTELRVGVLVIASFLLLATAIFFIGGETSPFAPTYTVFAYLPTANGLRAGAEVWLEGVTIGNVRAVRISKEPDPARSIEIEMRLDETYKNIIRTDSEVNIGTIGLLGDKIVEVSRGSEAGRVLEEGDVLTGTQRGDIERIIQGTDDFVANLEVLSDKINRMAERVDRGEGTLGKLLTDTSIYDNANLVMREANLLVRDARAGDGTVGKLINDDELYEKVNAMVERVDTLVEKIESGDGTAGRFVNDPSLYNRADRLVATFESVADRIERGEGTLGRLSRDEALYTDVRETVTQLRSLVASVEKGPGSAAKFINDPSLYNSLNQTSSEIQKLLYDFRQDPKKFLTIQFKLF